VADGILKGPALRVPVRVERGDRRPNPSPIVCATACFHASASGGLNTRRLSWFGARPAHCSHFGYELKVVPGPAVREHYTVKAVVPGERADGLKAQGVYVEAQH
jgi:hypothetical protein